MTFLDVGAGVGSYSLPAAKCGLRVIAMEPDPISFRLLLQNAKLNDVELEMVNAAAYDRKCTLIINPYLPLKKSKIAVEAIPLDELNMTADIVKIDVDGADINVLKGGVKHVEKGKMGTHRVAAFNIKGGREDLQGPK